VEKKMSEASTLVTAEHFRYMAEHTTREDPLLQELRSEARAAGLPPIWVSPEQAAFMQILLKLCKAREVIEVGTLGGYSAIWMARALPPDGRLRTIEVSDKHAEFAEEWVGKSDVSKRIEIIRGAGKDILPRFARDTVDAVFLDADKTCLSLYLKECLRLVRHGGLIMVDNAFAFGELFDSSERPSVAAMRAFNDLIAEEPALQGVIVPIGDGLWVAERR
jgi:predicted O-methyltransferase YrrM